jgi:RNA polymerase sigma-70 factor, ECF subfamily
MSPEPKAPAPDTNEQDRADMLRLAAGHDASLNALIERHAPRLFKYLLRSLQNEEDAADLAQETFVRIHQNRAKFDPEQKFSTWLYAIASNLVRTQFRHRTRHATVPLDTVSDRASRPLDRFSDTPSERFAGSVEQTPSPSESLQARETSEAVRRAIAALPEELRTPLILSEYQDLSHAEIGTILSCSPKAVETRLYRARKHLRAVLSRFLPDQ